MRFSDLLENAHPFVDCFDYDHYPDCFQYFKRLVTPFFDEMEEHRIDETAAGVFGEIQERWQTLPRKEQKKTMFKDKQVLVLFFSPAARQHSERALRFAEQLCDIWNTRFPRDIYHVGDYDVIMKGFDSNLLGLPLRKSRRH